MSEKIGVYIHVPFCAGKCPYCDFYSVTGTTHAMDSYFGAVLRCVPQYASVLSRGADTLYFGGGTPSLLGEARLGQMIAALQPYLTANAEITVECNPSDNLDSLIPRLAQAGVNRISLGMQSAVDAERIALGRKANRDRIEHVLNLCRANGITNLSLDLMLGIPYMTIESLDATLDFIIQSRVPHVSAYLLKIEPGTIFASHASQLALPDEDLVCDQYLHTVDRLSGAGLAQYEISNFSRSGYESRHNLKYWHCEEYLGLGPAAHSFVNGKRFFYPRDLDRFLQGTPPIPDGDGGGQEERLMLALRLTEGIQPALLSIQGRDKAAFFIKRGLMCEKAGRLSMTPSGFLISNAIISELIQAD